MKILLLLVCVGFSFAAKTGYQIYDIQYAEEYFEDFIKTYNKHYANDIEKSERFHIFVENLKSLNKQNMESSSAVFGINEFTDLTTEEFLQTYTGLKGFGGQGCTIQDQTWQEKAPDAFDWRDKNVLTKVKNQGRCGSCWAFSATGNLEAQYAIKHKQLIELSEQQLVDCDQQASGCNGSYLNTPHEYWINAGAMLEEDYPYEAVKRDCRYDASKVRVITSGCVSFEVSDEESLKDVLYKVGPLTIGVDAEDMKGYQGGVLPHCGYRHINHAVLLVGYGEDDEGPFWVIKNSWGETFGENGYIRIQRGVNACGINDEMKYSSTVV